MKDGVEETMTSTKWLEDVMEKLDRKLLSECNRMGDKIPYISENGVYADDMREVNLSWWTNSFWAGMMWQMYHSTGREEYKASAVTTELSLDQALANFEGLHHDVGFMWLHTAVANYRLTENERSRKRALHAATILAGRFNHKGKFIRAWNMDKTGWVIIDSMMNIHLLYWASRETGDPRFKDIADLHAETIATKLVREDGSCNHIAILDAETGEVIDYPAGQGFQSGSSWSRGQAWALYGFVLAYKNTENEKYLQIAKKIAHYFIANISETDYISLVDFRAPESPEQYDTTASACAACGLLELSGLVPEFEKKLYGNAAIKMIESLEAKYCDWDVGRDGILQYGTVEYHMEKYTHVPIIYGDYFLIEAILRLRGKDFLIW